MIIRILALLILTLSHQGIASTSKCSNPEQLLNKLNTKIEAIIEDLANLDPTQAEKQLKEIQKDLHSFTVKYWDEIECLKSNPATNPEELRLIIFRIELLEKAVVDPEALDKLLGELLDGRFDENDPEDVYTLRNHNRLKYLDTGSELRDEVLETIRSAKSFINLSYFELFPDRMGHTIAALLIAKKLGLNQPCQIKDVADTLGLPGPLNDSQCSDSRVITGPIQDESFAFPGKDKLIANVEQLKRKYPERSEIQIKIYLDDFKKLKRKLTKAGIVQALEAFGVQIRKEDGAVMWGSNHTKIAANEERAVISGGNVVDKVMDWNPQKRRWRDAAILVEGELVADINHFFLSKFHGVKHTKLNDYLCNGEPKCLSSYFPPLSEEKKAEYLAKARLVWTANFDFKTSPTWKALRGVIKQAQQSLYFENAFFSDGLSALFLRVKADEWDLKQAKEANKSNGEELRKSTCGPDYFDIVSKRPGGKYILVILPKHMDQPIVKAAEKVLKNHLILEGVDVCYWDSELNNKVHGTKDSKFEPKTMMHSKVFMADDKLAYVGTANLNRRSMKGDLEIGVLTNDPLTVQDIKEKMFVNDVKASECAKHNVLHYLYLPLQLLLNFILWVT